MARKRRGAAKSKPLDPPPEGYKEFLNDLTELIRSSMAKINKLKAQLPPAKKSKKRTKPKDQA